MKAVKCSVRIVWLGLAGLGVALLATLLPSGGAAPVALSPVIPPPTPVPEAKPAPDLVIHEWGTFLGMSGSDGTTLDGMYHEEHALPAFVHARSRDQLRLPFIFLKGETPVIYFYTEGAQ